MNSEKEIKDLNFRIGVIGNSVNDEGKRVYLTKFLNILLPLSNEIFVICGDLGASDEKFNIIKIKAGFKQESILIRFLNFILFQMRFSFNLIKISKKVDILIFFNATSLLPIFFAKIMGKKIIIVAGGLASNFPKKIYNKRFFDMGKMAFRFILKTLEKLAFTFSDLVAVESKSAINFLGLEKYKNKISIIGNMYLDLNKYRIKKEFKERKYLIGFISRLNEGKGIMNFVDAIPMVLKECGDVEFLIGGDGVLFDEIEIELENNNLCDIVELPRWISHDEIPDYLNKLKLLVFPSESEGLPNIVSEAMACGTPVLATPVGGVPDLVKDEETGFIMKSNSSECIAEHITRALNFPNLERITENARKMIEQNYNFENMVNKYRKMLIKL